MARLKAAKTRQTAAAAAAGPNTQAHGRWARRPYVGHGRAASASEQFANQTATLHAGLVHGPTAMWHCEPRACMHACMSGNISAASACSACERGSSQLGPDGYACTPAGHCQGQVQPAKPLAPCIPHLTLMYVLLLADRRTPMHAHVCACVWLAFSRPAAQHHCSPRRMHACTCISHGPAAASCATARVMAAAAPAPHPLRRCTGGLWRSSGLGPHAPPPT